MTDRQTAIMARVHSKDSKFKPLLNFLQGMWILNEHPTQAALTAVSPRWHALTVIKLIP